MTERCNCPYLIKFPNRADWVRCNGAMCRWSRRVFGRRVMVRKTLEQTRRGPNDALH